MLPLFGSCKINDSSSIRGENTKLNKCSNRKRRREHNEKDTRWRVTTSAKNLNLTCYQVGNLFYENLRFVSYRTGRIFSFFVNLFYFLLLLWSDGFCRNKYEPNEQVSERADINIISMFTDVVIVIITHFIGFFLSLWPNHRYIVCIPTFLHIVVVSNYRS